jgi:hypothetical protein
MAVSTTLAPSSGNSPSYATCTATHTTNNLSAKVPCGQEGAS